MVPLSSYWNCIAILKFLNVLNLPKSQLRWLTEVWTEVFSSNRVFYRQYLPIKSGKAVINLTFIVGLGHVVLLWKDLWGLGTRGLGYITRENLKISTRKMASSRWCPSQGSIWKSDQKWVLPITWIIYSIFLIHICCMQWIFFN